jgi:hypothetical protein
MRTRTVKMFDGRVDCPHVRNSVDVETCYRCSRLRGFYDEESETRVACAAPLFELSDAFGRVRPADPATNGGAPYRRRLPRG